MPHLCQRTLSKQRISNTYKPPRLPLAADRLFFMNRANYIVAVDYFSRYFEIIKLKSTTSGSVIEGLKSFFTNMVSLRLSVTTGHSIARTSLLNLPHLNMLHLVHYSRRAMDKQCGLFKLPKDCLNAKDPYMALLTYHSTLLTWCNLSTARLLIGRCLTT